MYTAAPAASASASGCCAGTATGSGLSLLLIIPASCFVSFSPMGGLTRNITISSFFILLLPYTAVF
jgi:hypothetical protein